MGPGVRRLQPAQANGEGALSVPLGPGEGTRTWVGRGLPRERPGVWG